MPESDLSTLVILLSSCVGLLLLILLTLLRISTKLSRLSGNRSQESVRQDLGEHAPSAAERSAGGAFESFLSEDPARRELPKGEQFSAYRQWRQEKGLNWSNS